MKFEELENGEADIKNIKLKTHQDNEITGVRILISIDCK